MPVYVDQPSRKPGALRACRMAADTYRELMVMVDALGIRRGRDQQKRSITSYYRLCLTERARAVGMGAIEVRSQDLSRAIVTLNNLLQPAATPPVHSV